MGKQALFIFLSFGLSLILFQNCSDQANFSPRQLEQGSTTFLGERERGLSSENDVKSPLTETDEENESDPQNEEPAPENSICNPLNPEEDCSDLTPEVGLIGNLYYMTPEEHGHLFPQGMSHAKIDDYAKYGTLASEDVVMTAINVTARSWESGFLHSDGTHVRNSQNEKLFEWFSLDISGFIELPTGDYHFGIISDDGMRVTLNGEVLINDDTAHAPRYACADDIVSFAEGEKKMIRIQYFQGPRYQIAMQLLMRPAENQDMPCGDSGGFEPLPPGVLTRY